MELVRFWAIIGVICCCVAIRVGISRIKYLTMPHLGQSIQGHSNREGATWARISKGAQEFSDNRKFLYRKYSGASHFERSISIRTLNNSEFERNNFEVHGTTVYIYNITCPCIHNESEKSGQEET